MTDAVLAALTARFRTRAVIDARRLREALDRVDANEVGFIAHALSGSAGTFGFALISEQAAELEAAVEAGQGNLDEAAAPLLATLDALA